MPPRRITALNWPPEECPNSAPNWFCSTLNSATESFGRATTGPVMSFRLLSVPSTMKLLFRGRWPPTEGPVPAPTPPELATPAPNKDRFRYPPAGLAATGRSDASRLAKMFAICAVLVSINAAESTTSTDSVAVPTESVTLAVAVLFSSTLRSLSSRLAKPADDTVTL